MPETFTTVDQDTGQVRVRTVPTALARFSRQTANAGTWVTFGSISVQMPASGNRSMQIRSAAGTISVAFVAWLNWDSAIAWTTVSLTTASTQYINSGWNFGNATNVQQTLIHDTTNTRAYRVVMQVGASYNNNIFSFEEVT